jgi:ABC-type sugar transport system substrate-binding protein
MARVALALALGALTGLNAGCKKSTDNADNKSAPGKPKVALIMKSLANEFFSTMAEGAKQHQAAHAADYDLIVNGIKNETDLAEQVNLVEQMIAQRVNAIVIAPADSKALVTVLKRAREAGILVVNIDNKLDADVLKQAELSIPFVGPDNRAGARKVGETLAKQLAPGDKVAIIEGIPTAFNSQQRRLGFEDAMKAAGMNVVSVQSGRWEMEAANNVGGRDAQRACGPQGHSVRERQHGPGRGLRDSSRRARPGRSWSWASTTLARCGRYWRRGRWWRRRTSTATGWRCLASRPP